jgi:heme/copper-type cytochrome/quinol oxidase subunit 4
MRNHLRFFAVLVVGLAAYVVLLHSFHLMNEASDRSLYGGIAEILGVILFVPLVVRAIWRRL